MIEFDYKEEHSDDKKVYRPVANIYVIYKDFKIEASFYIDSGADITLMPYKMGLALGFDRDESKVKQMRGISATVPYILKEVQLQIGDHLIKTRVAWALIEEVPALLGRGDVFDSFRIIFEQKKKKIFFDYDKITSKDLEEGRKTAESLF